MALAHCPGCSAAIPEGGNFCPACGRAAGDLERPREHAQHGAWVELVDRSWDFFASTKVAAVLIVLLAVASALGSLIEQESLYQDWRPPAVYYPIRYGETLGNLYLKLGLTHTYSSIWYATMVLICVVSLIICSLHRLVPLYRMLRNPQVWKLPHFLRRQDAVIELEGDLTKAEALLKKRGYRVLRDRECIYGDKGRISRYGPYVIHIGLIVVAIAAFAKAVPGWDVSSDVWVPEGQTVKVPGTDFAITNHKFTLDFYPDGAPSRYATDAGVVQNGQEVLRRTVEVNAPLSFEGWDVFQASFRSEPGVVHFSVVNAMNNQPLSKLDIDLKQPESEYNLSDKVKLVVRSYYHDFTVDLATGEPTNASYEVKNPVLMVEFMARDTGDSLGRTAVNVLSNDEPAHSGFLYLKVDKVDDRWFSGLKLHKDRTATLLWIGLITMMLGMLITFFVFHWQVWVREENGKLLVGGRAYKNKFGLKQELGRLFATPQGEGKVS